MVRKMPAQPLAHSVAKSFRKIERFYEQYYDEMKTKGVSSHKQTEKGFWVPSASSEVFELFQRINLHQFQHVVDLGSGDGKVALIASLFTKSTGVEWDEELVIRSKEIRNTLGFQNVWFEQGDFLQKDLSIHDVLFIHPDNPLGRLERKIMKEFDGDLIVCGGLFLPERLVEKDVIQIHNAVFRIYRRSMSRWPFF
jgi:hypothetical protein